MDLTCSYVVVMVPPRIACPCSMQLLNFPNPDQPRPTPTSCGAARSFEQVYLYIFQLTPTNHQPTFLQPRKNLSRYSAMKPRRYLLALFVVRFCLVQLPSMFLRYPRSNWIHTSTYGSSNVIARMVHRRGHRLHQCNAAFLHPILLSRP